MKWVIACVAGAALVVVTASAQAPRSQNRPPPARPAPILHLTERDDGRVLSTPVGSELRIQLEQPRGTPFQWELRNDRRIAVLDQPVTAASFGTGGRRQLRVFRLRIVEPGRFPLIFGLRSRDAGPDQMPRQRIVMTIDANPATRPPAPEWGEGADTVEPLTEADAGRRVDVPVGQRMTIALPSNASTGHYWYAAFPRNVRVLGDIREERGRNARIGAGGTSIVSFLVPSRGEAEVTMAYLPPGGGTPRRTLVYRFRGI